ncbi:MAG: DUF2249 domain-containing protein [Actinomycetota bacterium]|nr:DUF2249 domain-containing protein [Actinomycetota bacterium]
MTTTHTGTGAGALEAMLAHHAALADGVARRVATVRAAVERHDHDGAAAAELVAYLAQEVLPHAMAEEHTLYLAASSKPDLAETVVAMVDEHRQLTSLVERLATTGDAGAAAADAEAIDALFAGHVAKENELVLPPLAADAEVDLAGLLVQMHRLTEAAQIETPVAEDLEIPDAEATLVRLVLGAAGQLADVGRGDVACRLAAETWATVRVARPELAVRVTAALHRLVRSVTAEPLTLSAGPSAGPSAGRSAAVGGDAALDVRALAPAQRHEKIFATYHALGPATAFVLVNDHDPKPLRYQFEAEYDGRFTWEVLEAGPTVWRVRIGRPAGAASRAGDQDDADTPARAEPVLDVRRFPHGQRHDVIFTTFEALADGAGFVLVNDHDPKPLRYQFEAQHVGRYSWDYLETGPELWRVRIGRPAGQPA